jgi:hypothetical protein
MYQNYELLTGPFAGGIIEEGCCILDVMWNELPTDLQRRALDWGYSHKPHLVQMSKSDLLEAWEDSWDCCPTDEEVNLRPLSEWEHLD